MSVGINPRDIVYTTYNPDVSTPAHLPGPIGPVILGVQTYFGAQGNTGPLYTADGKEFRTITTIGGQHK